MTDTSNPKMRRNILSAAAGNVLEWYDFAVYRTLAPILGKLFFAADDPAGSLLAAFGVFAIGYIARPLGGILLGHIGDKFGRKRALILSVMMMGTCTTLIGCLPTHESLGTWAAVLLVTLRILQGLSVGGEYPGSIVFLAEHAPPKWRGYYSSWPMFGSAAGFLLGSALTTLITNIIGADALQEWGWRIPLLLGAVIALVGIYFRRHMTDPPVFAEAKPINELPLLAAVKYHWRAILRIVALSLVNAVGFYLLWVYAISYLTERMHVSTADALDINTLSLLVMMPVVTFVAILTDVVGRKPILYFVAIGTLLLA